MSLVRITTASLVLALTAGILAANPLVYEGFNYTPGSQVNLLNGGTGFGANAWSAAEPNYTIQSGSLTYKDLATSGNSATFSEPNLSVAQATRSLLTSGLGADGSNEWFSFLMQPGALTAGGLMQLQIEDLFIGETGQNKGFYAVGAGTALDSSTVPIVAGQTAFIAIDFQFNSDPTGLDTATVYFDPTPGLASPDVTGLVWQENFSSAITAMFFEAADGQSYSFDEIRMGDTYGDVSPVSTTATPEPSLAWLSGLGLLTLLGRHALARRRRANP
jgi:hypothetical protein